MPIGRLLGLGPQSNTTTRTSTPTVPADVQALRRDLFQRAGAFAAQEFQPYTAQRFAEFTPDELAGFEAARNIAATSGGLAPLSTDLTREGVAAARGLATRLPEVDLSGYMSPYTEAVLQPALRDIGERAERARLELGQRAARTGSFGGSRQAIAESELERGTQRTIGEESARQRAAAYNEAVRQFREDQQRIPQLYSGALGQVGTGLAQTAARLGTEVAPLSQIGGAQRALEQAELDFQRQQFEEERNFPLRGIEVLRASLGLSPQVLGIGSTDTTVATQPAPNLVSQLGGALLRAPDLISGAKSAYGGLSALGSAALGFLSSDERMKTDIEEIGEDPETGLMMYAYRYKGDPKSYPKVVGPLAQEVEEMYPERVTEVAGRKVIIGGLAGLGREDDDEDDD